MTREQRAAALSAYIDGRMTAEIAATLGVDTAELAALLTRGASRDSSAPAPALAPPVERPARVAQSREVSVPYSRAEPVRVIGRECACVRAPSRRVG